MNKEDIEYYENQDIEELVFMCISKDNIIKHLEKRIKELEEGFKATTQELCEYAEKNSKAIEYIDNNSHYYNADGEINFTIEEEKEETFCKDLLKILKGEDNDRYNK